MIAITIISLLSTATTVFTAVEAGTRLLCEWIEQHKRDRAAAIEILDNLAERDLLAMQCLSDAQITPDQVVPENIISCGMELDFTTVKEKRHRRLPHCRGTRNDYLKTVIAECKAKLGTPTDKEANRMVIRRVARGLMEAHGLRPTHQQAIMQMVIEGVLTPGTDELMAKRWARSTYVTWRRSGAPWTFWSWCLQDEASA